MYPQLTLPTIELPGDIQAYQKCLVAANWTLIASVVLLTFSIAISFVFPTYFSLGTQMAAHVATIVLAGVLKVGYVLRCVAMHGLGEEV
ncbi:hypothetical protein EYS14_16595 [Alteromonadaceae bacterium M269]|nr:hypothetical protein EYS14_16595 [Alteromonadaceae bacterium M269]